MTFSPDSTLLAGARLPDARLPARQSAALPTAADVVVIGAGVIGLSIGWELVGHGLSVVVVDSGPAGGGASGAATGMLAASAELEPGGSDLLNLALESRKLWPGFCAALEQAAGLSIDFRSDGTLVAAIGREEIERLRFRYGFHRRNGLGSVWLSGPELREREPGLRPSVSAGILCEEDHQVDPRRLVPALCRALVESGGQLVEFCQVDGLDFSAGRVTGVRTASAFCRTKTVVLATGAWSGSTMLLPPTAFKIPVRPLKGQALALRMTAGSLPLRHVVWTEQVHLAPKSDGRLIVGATVEERGFDASVTAGGALALLDGARRALPSIEEMEIEAIFTGFRPTSIDDAPILGSIGVEGLVVATGHHRNGILLAPVTAKAIARLVVDGAMPDFAAAFGIDRFAVPGEPHP